MEIITLLYIRSLFFACCLLLLAGATVPIDAKIVFCVDDIFLMNDDGSRRRRLTHSTQATHRYPRWSADGQRIFFAEVKWFRDGDVEKLIVQRIGGAKQEITDINDRLGNKWLGADATWMEEDRVILFSLKFLDKPTPNYNLYHYGLETRSLRRLTRETSDEKWPDWHEGSLSVSPHRYLVGETGLGPARQCTDP